MAWPYPVWTEHVRLSPCPSYPYYVPDRLWRQSELTAKRVTLLPRHIKSNRHDEYKPYDLANLRDRATAYTRIITFGAPQQIWQLLDAEMLLEVWDDLILPRPDILPAWQDLIDRWKITREYRDKFSDGWKPDDDSSI